MRAFRLLTCFVLFLLCAGIRVEAQKRSDSILNKRIQWNKVYTKDLKSTLVQIAVFYRIPISFEPQLNTKDEAIGTSKPQVKQKDLDLAFVGVLRDVLNKLIALYPEYQWNVENCVIRVFPLYDEDTVITDILDTELAEFSFQEYPGRMSVGDAITDTEEVRQKLRILKLTEIHYYSGDSFDKESNSGKTLDLKKTTVRHILNTIIQESSFRFWTIIRWGKSMNFLTILSY